MCKKFTIDEVNNKLPKNCFIISEYKNSTTNAIFQCPYCINTFTTKPEHVFSGHTKSCGCLTLKRRTGIGELSGAFYCKLKVQAKHRKMTFNLSKEFLYEMLKKQNFKCALSGIPIEIGYKKGDERSKITASLDRIDSSKGYEEDNVQWVHKKINMMKGSLSEKEFYNFCLLIVNNKAV